MRENSLVLLLTRLRKQKMNDFYMAYYTITRLFDNKRNVNNWLRRSIFVPL